MIRAGQKYNHKCGCQIRITKIVDMTLVYYGITKFCKHCDTRFENINEVGISSMRHKGELVIPMRKLVELINVIGRLELDAMAEIRRIM